MKHSFFSEHRLIFVTKAALDAQRKAAGAAPSLTQSQNRAAIRTETARRDTIQQNVQKQTNTNRALSGGDLSVSRSGVTRDQYNNGLLPTQVTNTKTGQSKTWYASAEQKRAAERGRAEGALVESFAKEEAQLRESGGYDPYLFEQRKATALNKLYSDFSRKDAKNSAFSQERATSRAGVNGVQNPGTKTAGAITEKTRPGTTFDQRVQERGKMRSERLGLGASGRKPPQKTQGGGQGASGAPEADIPTKVYETPTKTQGQAAAALQGDGLEGPDSLTGIVDEEMTAVDPALDAQAGIRDSFKIYQKGAQGLLDQRGAQIDQYKTDGIERAEQVASAKIEQSKSNRDLELELITDARERARRDELLTQEKTETDYEREEDRIIGENEAQVERMQTALGARYGGFGSGKGIAKIEAARDQASEVLRQLNEDRIYARREGQNVLDDIESTWQEDRKITFQRHDQNITAAYTAMMEAAQSIDDNALDEEGEKIDASIDLLRQSFDAMEKVWTATGDALTKANQRALDRRDTLRKETYEKQQDALANIFSGLSTLPASSPFFRDLEKKAGLTPGTIAGSKSFEERRIAISEAGLRINQQQLGIQLAEFERNGNQIDTNASKLLGRIVTSTGESFRDYFGNPVSIVGEGGSITSSTSNDAKLYGQEAIGMGSTVNFSNYALALGDIVPGSPYHKGGEYDIDAAAGTPIPAWSTGTVSSVGYDDDYGNYVDVFDGVNTTRYAHLQKSMVKPGDVINGFNSGNGQIVGLMGNTGNVMGMDGHRPNQGDMQTGSHLHLEVRSGNDFKSGAVLDPMNVGMQPGMMHSGKITWVDDMRKKLRQGAPVGTSLDGTTFGVDLDTPWQEIDQQVLDIAKDSFRTPDGGTDWAALDLVHDYLQQNKMGQYDIAYNGKGSVDASYSLSKDRTIFNYAQEKLFSEVRQGIQSGDMTPEDIYASWPGETEVEGTKITVTKDMIKDWMSRLGYTYEQESWANIFPGGAPFNDRFSRLAE